MYNRLCVTNESWLLVGAILYFTLKGSIENETQILNLQDFYSCISPVNTVALHSGQWEHLGTEY